MQTPFPSTLLWIGVDVSKATFDAALWGHQDFQKMIRVPSDHGILSSKA